MLYLNRQVKLPYELGHLNVNDIDDDYDEYNDDNKDNEGNEDEDEMKIKMTMKMMAIKNI